MIKFVVHPKENPNNAKVWTVSANSFMAIDMKELEDLITGYFWTDPDIEDFVFYPVGDAKPITFKKHISYTMNQD
jgi:hypothetical protein